MGNEYGRPSGVTAIAAAVLAVIAGIGFAAGAVWGLRMAADAGHRPAVDSDLPDLSAVVVVLGVAVAAVAGVLAVLFVIGAALLFARRTAGQVLIVVAAVLAAPSSVFGFGRNAVAELAGIFALCVVMVVLAVVPATGRWVAARSRPVRPPGYR
ncbi:hypothetical protein [Nocardia arizonensis]|uniref:hypothetical protein n=1 Tax=Nocardia arizonensis TaxID=1141647 RepID=UPI0006D1EE7F|nr:hypothetical protein [Nocardia arizonensis]